MAGNSRDERLSDVCPLYADLKGLCPALFSVGTKDALLDDALFVHAWSMAAGNAAELAMYPGVAWVHAVAEWAVG